MTDPRSNEPPRLECHDASRAIPGIPVTRPASDASRGPRMIDLEMRQARNGEDRAPEPDSPQADGIDDVPPRGLADQTSSTPMDQGHPHARSWSRSPTRCPGGAPTPRAGGAVSAQAHGQLGWSLDGSGQRREGVGGGQHCLSRRDNRTRGEGRATSFTRLVKVLAQLDRDAEVELFPVLPTPICTVGSDRSRRDIRMPFRASQTLSHGPPSAVGRATLAHQIVEGADSGLGS